MAEDYNDSFGLDKVARVRAQQLAEIRREKPVLLEPGFPYGAFPAFDPEFFKIPANPRKAGGSEGS